MINLFFVWIKIAKKKRQKRVFFGEGKTKEKAKINFILIKN